jgi:hypothetical protein
MAVASRQENTAKWIWLVESKYMKWMGMGYIFEAVKRIYQWIGLDRRSEQLRISLLVKIGDCVLATKSSKISED